jgi:uncharacterized membrane protein
MAATSAGAPTRATTDLTGIVLGVVAAAQVLAGLLGFLAPGAFYDLVAPFPPENHHVLRDVGSWQIALGLAAAVAVRRRSWRVPMLAILTLQYALHAISHLIDVGDADPSWIGPAELVLLAVAALALAGLLIREHRS